MPSRPARAPRYSRAEARQALTGILSRPGEIPAQIDEIFEVYDRLDRAADPEPPARCQNPEGPHPGTALVGKPGRCPICGWSPDPVQLSLLENP